MNTPAAEEPLISPGHTHSPEPAEDLCRCLGPDFVRGVEPRVDLSEHIVSEFRAKAEELRQFAGTHTADPWRRSVILRFARDCEVLADEYQHQLRRQRRREQ